MAGRTRSNQTPGKNNNIKQVNKKDVKKTKIEDDILDKMSEAPEYIIEEAYEGVRRRK